MYQLQKIPGTEEATGSFCLNDVSLSCQFTQLELRALPLRSKIRSSWSFNCHLHHLQESCELRCQLGTKEHSSRGVNFSGPSWHLLCTLVQEWLTLLRLGINHVDRFCLENLNWASTVCHRLFASSFHESSQQPHGIKVLFPFYRRKLVKRGIAATNVWQSVI